VRLVFFFLTHPVDRNWRHGCSDAKFWSSALSIMSRSKMRKRGLLIVFPKV